jgi:hypothetical protein
MLAEGLVLSEGYYASAVIGCLGLRHQAAGRWVGVRLEAYIVLDLLERGAEAELEV